MAELVSRRNFIGAAALAALSAGKVNAANNCSGLSGSAGTGSSWNIALNTIQWIATPDGWIDPRLLPPLEELLPLVKSTGFNAVPPDIPRGMPLREYMQRMDEAGLVSAPGYLSIRLPEEGSSQEATLESARRAAEQHVTLGLDTLFVAMAQIRGAPRVLQPARGAAFDQGRLDNVTELVEKVANVLRAEGIRPALHQHVGGWIETEKEVHYVLEQIGPDLLDFGPDIGHLHWAGIDPAKIIAAYRDRVTGLHIKDLRGAIAESSRTGTGTYMAAVIDGLWIEPGRGDLDIKAVFEVLGADYSGWAIVENDRPDLPVWESAVFSAAWMRMNLPGSDFSAERRSPGHERRLVG